MSKEMRKAKFKSFLKAKKGWVLGTGLFAVVGLITLLVGFWITGWSLIEWLKSPYALTFFILLAIALYGGLMLFLLYKRHNLGGY